MKNALLFFLFVSFPSISRGQPDAGQIAETQDTGHRTRELFEPLTWPRNGLG